MSNFEVELQALIYKWQNQFGDDPMEMSEVMVREAAKLRFPDGDAPAGDMRDTRETG